MDDARNWELLSSLGIGHILNVTSDCPNFFEENGIVYQQVPIDDTWQQNISSYFYSSIEFIRSAQAANSKVLVHCKAGVSRSPTIVIAYLMQASKMTLTEAYSTVRAARPFISPNLDFMGHLIQFQKTLEPREGCRRDSKCDPFAIILPSSASDADDILMEEVMESPAAVAAAAAATFGNSTLAALFTCGPRSPRSPFSFTKPPASPSVCHSPITNTSSPNSLIFS